MSERKVSEPKQSKCGTFKYRTVKLGNTILGVIEPYKSQAVYWVSSQSVGRVAEGGKVVIFSRPKIAGLTAYGVKKVGLRLADGATYLAPIERVTQAPDAVVSLPVEECEVEMPEVEERADTLFAKMRIAGGRGRK